MILDGSRKTMNFIVLPYSLKRPLFTEYNASPVSKIPNITNQIVN